MSSGYPSVDFMEVNNEVQTDSAKAHPTSAEVTKKSSLPLNSLDSNSHSSRPPPSNIKGIKRTARKTLTKNKFAADKERELFEKYKTECETSEQKAIDRNASLVLDTLTNTQGSTNRGSSLQASCTIMKNVPEPSKHIPTNTPDLSSDVVQNAQKPSPLVKNVQQPSQAVKHGSSGLAAKNVPEPASQVVKNVQQPSSVVKNSSGPESRVVKNVTEPSRQTEKNILGSPSQVAQNGPEQSSKRVNKVQELSYQILKNVPDCDNKTQLAETSKQRQPPGQTLDALKADTPKSLSNLASAKANSVMDTSSTCASLDTQSRKRPVVDNNGSRDVEAKKTKTSDTQSAFESADLNDILSAAGFEETDPPEKPKKKDPVVNSSQTAASDMLTSSPNNTEKWTNSIKTYAHKLQKPLLKEPSGK